MGKGRIIELIAEWVTGLLILIASALATYIAYFIVISIYDLWDDMIN